jgi:hypothetical protein
MQVTRPDPSELLLRLLHAASSTQRWLHLHGCWVDVLATPGDTINVVFTPQNRWVVDSCGAMHATITNNNGLVILHPDILCSGTTIAASIKCPRQAMLQECAVGGSGKAACIGTLMHELVQTSLAATAELPIQDSLPHRPPPLPRGVHLPAIPHTPFPSYCMTGSHCLSTSVGCSIPLSRKSVTANVHPTLSMPSQLLSFPHLLSQPLPLFT